MLDEGHIVSAGEAGSGDFLHPKIRDALLGAPDLSGPIKVFLYGDEWGNWTPLYTHTYPRRTNIDSVYEDIEAGYRMATDHWRQFSKAWSDIKQGDTYLLGIREKFSVNTDCSLDDFEGWEGPGGQQHESFRWAD